MNVRLIPRDAPKRTDLYGGIDVVHSDGTMLKLIGGSQVGGERWFEEVHILQRHVAEILLDDEPGDWW